MTDDYDDPTEAQVAAFEDQLEDLSEKDLLIGILAELKWLRVALTTDAEAGEAPDVYRCDTCGDRVAADERERHLVDQHKAPPGVDVAAHFDAVE